VNQLLNELIPFVSHYGLWVVFLGMMIEGTMMILATGVLCYLGMLSVTEAIPVAVAGAVAGDQLWYTAGRFFSPFIFEKFPSIAQRARRLESSIQKRGGWFAFGERFIYSGAILFPVTLGTYKYPHRKFTLFDTLGVTLWSFTGITLGYVLGTSVEALSGKMEKVWHLLAVLLIIVAGTWLLRRKLPQGKKAKNETLMH